MGDKQSPIAIAPVTVDGMQVGVVVSRTIYGTAPSMDGLTRIAYASQIDAPVNDGIDGNIHIGGDHVGQSTTPAGHAPQHHTHGRIKPEHGPTFRGPRHEKHRLDGQLPRQGLPGGPSGPAVRPPHEHEHHDEKTAPPSDDEKQKKAPSPEENKTDTHDEKPQEKGKANESDIDYLAKHGGHSSHMEGGHITSGRPGAAIPLDPEFAARLHKAGEAYTKETGKEPVFGEMDRGPDVQSVYYNRYKTGRGGIAAPPGRSRHQSGKAEDTPSGDFLNWLHKHGKEYGLHFPVMEKRGDDVGHTEPIEGDTRKFATPGSSKQAADEPPSSDAAGVKGKAGGPSGEPGSKDTSTAPVSGGFDRSSLKREVEQDPSLFARSAAMVAGEIYPDSATTKAKRIQLQTAMNRAQARGHSLEQALWDTAHHGSKGYYPVGTFNRGYNYIHSHPQWLEDYRKNVWEPSMAGSTESDVPGVGILTGNASGDVARHQRGHGTRNVDLRHEGGDQYFVEPPFRVEIPRLPSQTAKK